MILGISCDAGGAIIPFVGGNNSRNFRTNAGVNPKIETRKLGTLFIKRKGVKNA
jgi:hypothetical protein